MSSLKFELHKNEFILDKVSKDLWFVIKIDTHSVWIRKEDENNPTDDCEIRQLPKHLVNLAFIKVNPDAIKILFGDKQKDPNAIKPSFE